MLFAHSKLQDGRSNLQGAGKVYPMSRMVKSRNSFAFSYWKA
ncbi:hypothetical protein FOQG_09455 [Fusarium oxysporum f. sp. raphani 54005]|nr:hypothetical protein FOVG_06483 [Fusarium oxysporum f. sp. pisi HDV247]EXK87206.1 hypothetical protein FOQG_09455 [Fusarium oxysporum f. sp. raphani 54005]EXL70063.1 hypothetical protein FOPG_14076 [Fusarium oxysporum f. sp. conglutinans race 2 54008]EXM22731.1 hypothetical protein FOTG_09892 [Fusarium oxysporum f. sp. vasinfectum 25433]